MLRAKGEFETYPRQKIRVIRICMKNISRPG